MSFFLPFVATCEFRLVPSLPIADSLYRRWLKSPAFGTWLAQQENIVQTVLNDSPLIPPASIIGTPLLRG